MARPRENKLPEEIVQEAFEKDAAEAREARRLLVEEMQAKIRAHESPAPVDYRPQFKAWWAQARIAYKRQKDLEEILWIHLKTIGCAIPEKFEEGASHFGLKK